VFVAGSANAVLATASDNVVVRSGYYATKVCKSQMSMTYLSLSSVHQTSLLFFPLSVCTGVATTGSNFTSPPPLCPGRVVTFTCSVVDPGGLRSTVWIVDGNQCGLSHPIAPTQLPCGPLFSATLGGPQGDCFTSTLTATVGRDDNGLSALCYAFATQPQFLVGNATVQVIGELYSVLYMK